MMMMVEVFQLSLPNSTGHLDRRLRVRRIGDGGSLLKGNSWSTGL